MATGCYTQNVDSYSAGILLYFLTHCYEDIMAWEKNMMAIIKRQQKEVTSKFAESDPLLNPLLCMLLYTHEKRLYPQKALEFVSRWETSAPKEFLLRMEGKSNLTRFWLDYPTVTNLQLLLQVDVDDSSRVIFEERTIGSQRELIEINTDEDVECMFRYAEKKRDDVVVFMKTIQASPV
jgi:hypothetical protein